MGSVNLKTIIIVDAHDAEARGTIAMNRFLSAIYREGFWIPCDRAKSQARLFYIFLRSFQYAAAECKNRNMNRYAYVPKVHMLHHAAVRLHYEASNFDWAQNPLGTSVQIQEDFIGRPSRLSRRVSIQSIHMRVLQRSLISASDALRASDEDTRF